jgi:hypothetical protein
MGSHSNKTTFHTLLTITVIKRPFTLIASIRILYYKRSQIETIAWTRECHRISKPVCRTETQKGNRTLFSSKKSKKDKDKLAFHPLPSSLPAMQVSFHFIAWVSFARQWYHQWKSCTSKPDSSFPSTKCQHPSIYHFSPAIGPRTNQ